MVPSPEAAAMLEEIRQWSRDGGGASPEALAFLLAQVAPLMARIEELDKDVARLRKQNHDAAAKRDAEAAPLLRNQTYLRMAREMHEAEMSRKGKPLWSEISGYGQDTAAEILKQRDDLAARLSEVEAALRTSEEWRERFIARCCHDGTGTACQTHHGREA